MGIIRPQHNDDGAGRWAITLTAGDTTGYLIGTRTAVLDANRVLIAAGQEHAVYRRPGRDHPWQLVGAYPAAS